MLLDLTLKPRLFKRWIVHCYPLGSLQNSRYVLALSSGRKQAGSWRGASARHAQWGKARKKQQTGLKIGHFHDDVILLLRPESFRVLLSCANCGFCYLNLNGITKFKYERKNKKDSGRTSKMTQSCKWSVVQKANAKLIPPPRRLLFSLA